MEKRREVLTPEQDAAILRDVAEHHERKYAIVFRFMLGTGLRRGEVGKLLPFRPTSQNCLP